MSTSSKKSVTVVLTRYDQAIRQMVDGFMYNLDYKGQSVIGLDALWTIGTGMMHVKGNRTRISHLLFCNGDNCFVVHIGSDSSSFPKPLLTLFQQPDFSFVGMGIKDNLAKLDTVYEVRCKNAVELGPLAAKLMNDPRLYSCGIDVLKRGISLPVIDSPLIVYSGEDSGSNPNPDPFREYELGGVDREQLSRTVANTYAYHRIGMKLLLD